MTDWRKLYAAAAVETNPLNLEVLLRDAGDAIWLRMQELTVSPDGQIEQLEMEDALKNILIWRMQKLGKRGP